MAHHWPLGLRLVLCDLLVLHWLLRMRLLELLHGLGPLRCAVLHRRHRFGRWHTGLTVKQMIGATRRGLNCSQSAAIIR